MSCIIQSHFLFIDGHRIGASVAKHENNNNEPNIQDGQSDGAGHGKIGFEFNLAWIYHLILQKNEHMVRFVFQMEYFQLIHRRWLLLQSVRLMVLKAMTKMTRIRLCDARKSDSGNFA